MGIQLFDHQKRALERIKTGSILRGGVGSGKSLTALAYYVTKVCGGSLQINGQSGWSPMKIKKKLYIITTAKKRDDLDWEKEGSNLLIEEMIVDSWNNLHKYIFIKDAFFIFDEQRLVGSGVWVKSFLQIAKSNQWVLLTATPGDRWMDYIPVFIANGYYKNRTEFIRRHVVYKRFSRFPAVDRYLEVSRLIRIRDAIVVPMQFKRKTISHEIDVKCFYSHIDLDTVKVKRWNIFTDKPIRDVSEMCYALRRVVNSNYSRLAELYEIYTKHNKVIVFYNFNYELDALCEFCKSQQISFTQWNGHKHEPILKLDKYLYFVQYTAGCEGWNCIDTNCIVFFSQNYSYKVMVQAAGRIDRINTPFVDLYYYHFISNSSIDLAIRKALKNKETFNEHNYSRF